MPTTPVVAPLIGQTEVEIDGQTEDVRMASTRLVRGFNALGLPALAVPAGFTRGGLPIGMQLVGRPFGEQELLRIGAALEDATDTSRGARKWPGDRCYRALGLPLTRRFERVQSHLAEAESHPTSRPRATCS